MSAVRIRRRDVHVLSLLATYRWLTVEQIIRAIAADPDVRTFSKVSAYRRLRLLRKAGYIDARRDADDGTKYFAIGNKGAAELSRQSGTPPGKLYWRWKNRQFKTENIKHESLVGGTMIAFDAAFRQRPGLQHIERAALLARLPGDRPKQQHPFVMRADYHDTARTGGAEIEEITVNPDWFFGCLDKSGFPSWIALEADCRNHPIKRSSIANHRQVYRKMLGYYLVHQQRAHVAALGIENFRVLWIVRTKMPKPRIANMQRAALQATDGALANLFLFAPAEAIEDGDILAYPFENARGEVVSIFG